MRPRAATGVRLNLLVLVVATQLAGATLPSPVLAHHSHPYFYDQCRTITVEGLIGSVQWKDPHTPVVLKLDDGTTYAVDWMGLRGLTNSRVVGPAQAALVPGARVAVTGNPIRTLAQIREHVPDYKYEVNPRTIDPRLIRRVDDSFTWTQQDSHNPPDCGGR